jgi:hypothetical protein
MQEKHHALRSRIVNNHSSELHVGIDVYEADFRFRILRTRHVDPPSCNQAIEDEDNRQQLLYR